MCTLNAHSLNKVIHNMSVYVARYPCSPHHLGYLLSLTIWSYALLLLCAIDVIFYQVNMLMLSKQPI